MIERSATASIITVKCLKQASKNTQSGANGVARLKKTPSSQILLRYDLSSDGFKTTSYCEQWTILNNIVD